MTVTQRKQKQQPEEITIVNEPGFRTECDSCQTDLTHSVRIKCADTACAPKGPEDGGVDICPSCFCAGAEFAQHKRNHTYRIIEVPQYPIFVQDWGADEELLLIEGISLHGMGNWEAIAKHIGTRTKDEVRAHYEEVYIRSSNWPLPNMDTFFDVDPDEFRERKRRRISSITTNVPSGPKVAPTSAPSNHEIAGYLPGRLEFEHEPDNDAEDLVKDLEFGLCHEWGGDNIPEDENDQDVKTRAKWEEERFHTRDRENEGSGSRMGTPFAGGKTNGFGGGGKGKGKGPMMGKKVGGKKSINGYHPHGMKTGPNGGVPTSQKIVKSEDLTGDAGSKDKDKDKDEDEVEENMPPIPFETPDSLTFKLTLLEAYGQRVEKRNEVKALIFNRGLLEHKKMIAADKKRPKEDKDIVHRLRPFARLQTAEDYEVFCADILYEAILRKRIAELQQYRRLGLTTAGDINKWQEDTYKREQAKVNLSRDHLSSVQLRAGGRGSLGPDSRRASVLADAEGRKSHDRELTPKNSSAPAPGPAGRKPPAPLNLANSPSLHLLTPAEQTLCSTLRILPKPYLVIKETLVREYARRGGKLRRREARDLVKIDVNKTSRVWDFLVQAGYLRIGQDLSAAAAQQQASGSGSQRQGSTQADGQQDGSGSGSANGILASSSSSSVNLTASASNSSPRKTPSFTSLPTTISLGTNVTPAPSLTPSSSQTHVNGTGHSQPNGLSVEPPNPAPYPFASMTFPNAPPYNSFDQ